MRSYFLRHEVIAGTVWLWSLLVLLPRVAVADILKRRGHLGTRSVLQAVIDGRAPLPAFGEVRLDEPIPKQWLPW